MAISTEKNVQILIYLLKQNNIKKIIASPGTTNVAFVSSVQDDDFFQVYSCVDERSAAYMACGMSAESNEAVVLTCTGATASRNYLSGLTEAFYRKLPILAVTSTQPINRIGHNTPQMIDRTNVINDVAKSSYQIPVVSNSDTEWEAEVKINSALIDLLAPDNGPVHLNLTTAFENSNTVAALPTYRHIRCYYDFGDLPDIQTNRVAIFIGNHKVIDKELQVAIDEFCQKYNGVVLCDHTSKYHGKYKVLFSLTTSQEMYDSENRRPELLIDLGEVSGAYMRILPRTVWRVDCDGKVRDTFKKLTRLFKMSELDFFSHYNKKKEKVVDTSYFDECSQERLKLLAANKEVPFSNIYIASVLSKELPEKSILHLGILNTLRSWNFFDIAADVDVYCNTGGFGIDGDVSSLIGASLVHPDREYYGIVGDLAFFYDMNSIGNRHVGNNIHLLVINNGKGTEFRNYTHMAHVYGEKADEFIAAAGHFGNKSGCLIKHYCEDLGFRYLSARNKEEFQSVYPEFMAHNEESPVVMEVLTNSTNESDALKIMRNLIVTADKALKSKIIHLIGKK